MKKRSGAVTLKYYIIIIKKTYFLVLFNASSTGVGAPTPWDLAEAPTSTPSRLDAYWDLAEAPKMVNQQGKQKTPSLEPR
jgi:hypothetical protein